LSRPKAANTNKPYPASPGRLRAHDALNPRASTVRNTNGLLRQYFPKGTDLSIHSASDLDWVAQELNDRPRKRLAFKKPIELIGDLLLR